MINLSIVIYNKTDNNWKDVYVSISYNEKTQKKTNCNTNTRELSKIDNKNKIGVTVSHIGGSK